MASHLERRFKIGWQAIRGPKLVEEFKFHPVRKWRADFAHLDSMTLIEVEGGVWSNGRHNRGQGFIDDCAKYLEANLLGYRVIRLTEEQLDADTLDRIARFCEQVTASDCDLLALMND